MNNLIHSLFKNKIDKEVNKKFKEIIYEKETKVNRSKRENDTLLKERNEYKEMYWDRVQMVKKLNRTVRELKRKLECSGHENIELIRKLNKKSQK